MGAIRFNWSHLALQGQINDVGSFKMDLEIFDGFCSVGWIAPDQRFSTAIAHPVVLRAVKWMCRFRKQLLRTPAMTEGSRCSVCHQHVGVMMGFRKVWLGYGTIYVHRMAGGFYRCPDLIYHYMHVHDYKPPQCFVDDLLNDYRKQWGSGWRRAFMAKLRQQDLDPLRP